MNRGDKMLTSDFSENKANKEISEILKVFRGKKVSLV